MNRQLFILAVGLLLPFCWQTVASATSSVTISQPSTKSSKQAIEQFLSLTAIRMLEMEWTHAYKNKTPKEEDFREAMLASGIWQCPTDFQEAWNRQLSHPGRNYTAPILRKYNIHLKDIRERLQGELFKINPYVHPPIPLYDEDEQVPRMDPRSCGEPQAILKTLYILRAQLMGMTPYQLSKAKQAIERVMLEFSLAYMETTVCMNTAGIRESRVRELFTSIKTENCPEDFIKAWKHDLPFFLKGHFTGSELILSIVCKKYDVNEQDLLLKVRKKMKEWNIQCPTSQTQARFLNDMKEIRENMLSGYKSN